MKSKLDLSSYDVQDKLVVIRDADLNEEEMGYLSTKFKKLGAIEVVYAFGGIALDTLSEKDLRLIGLKRISKEEMNLC